MMRFKELCMDAAHDVDVLGRFWAAVTGGRYHRAATDEVGDVTGSVEGMGISIGPVPEVKTVKHRVHLDVHTDSVESLLALGATRATGYDDADPWTVLLDPEGGELCAFPRDGQLPDYRVHELVVDAADPAAITGWWGAAFGARPRQDGHDWLWLEDVPGMPFDSIVFQPVPEPKTVKNRIHWDVYGDVPALLDLGATILAELPRWTVMADPEGNEFCVFAETPGTG